MKNINVETTRPPFSQIRSQRGAGLAGFEKALAVQCGVVRPAYLPLPQSLALYDRLRQHRMPERASGRLDQAGMRSTLAAAQRRFPDEDCIVILQRYWFIGGLRMQLATFWAKAFDLLTLDGTAVFVARPQSDDALMLDLDAGEDTGGTAEPRCEIFAWGQNWPVYLPPTLQRG